MFVPFNALPAAARIWIFQASRPFTPLELDILDVKLRGLCEEWAVHGSPLETSFVVKFDQFVVLAADDSRQSPSGCSIDSSVRILKDLSQSLGIDLFDRSQVAFRTGNSILLVPVRDLKEKFEKGILSADTLTFNNLVSTKGGLEKDWMVAAGESWTKRYIPDRLANVK